VSLFQRRQVRGDHMLPGFARERRYSSRWVITASLGSSGDVQIGWDAGATEDEAIETFLEFLEDEDEVRAVSPEEVPRSGFRRLHVIFSGSHKTIVFRPEWVAGFTVERG
jgi:hypothetical protein